MEDLAPGDVLSYSAGSTQTGPFGYRKLRARGNALAVAGRRWPELMDVMKEGTVLFINAYPASVGTLSSGITVDTYLSPRILSRALQLANLGEHPTILVGQPLFLAHALLQHVAAGRPLPDTLMLWVGGYVMPQSLERMLVSLVEPHLRRCLIVQYFGAAEVDAGCMMGRERTREGHLIYYPRDDIEPQLDGDQLLLTLRSPAGEPILERFRTGDLARRHEDGWVIWNPKRLHPEVEAALESWTDVQWKQRTGYLRRDGDTIWIQLRQGQSPTRSEELEHFDFARRFGFAWLEKPYWR